jgi:sodium-independent sulfate anion transporter 11
VIIVLTLASWLYTRHRKNKKGQYPIKILNKVPAGFQHVGLFTPDTELVSALGGQLPVATIILLLEHIAISKCMSLSASVADTAADRALQLSAG